MTVKTKRQQAVESGRWAEKMAAWYLRFKGYRIIDVNVTTPVAQIDLIARKGKTWIIVEVKYRKSMAEAAKSIRYTQQQRLVRGAKYLLSRWPQLHQATIRFDAILMTPKSWPRHVQNAWWEADHRHY